MNGANRSMIGNVIVHEVVRVIVVEVIVFGAVHLPLIIAEGEVVGTETGNSMDSQPLHITIGTTNSSKLPTGDMVVEITLVDPTTHGPVVVSVVLTIGTIVIVPVDRVAMMVDFRGARAEIVRLAIRVPDHRNIGDAVRITVRRVVPRNGKSARNAIDPLHQQSVAQHHARWR